MKLFKSKEEKEAEKKQKLLKELEELNTIYKDIENCYCKSGEHIFIFKGFIIDKNKEYSDEIYVRIVDSETPEGYVTVLTLNEFHWKFKTSNISVARSNFIRYKKYLSDLGLELVPKNQKDE